MLFDIRIQNVLNNSFPKFYKLFSFHVAKEIVLFFS